MRKITQPGGSWLPALLVSALVHAGTGAFGGAVRLGLLNALQLLPLTLAPSLPAIIEREREEGSPVIALSAVTQALSFLQIALFRLPA